MKRRSWVCAVSTVVLLGTSASAAEPSRFTEKCNTQPTNAVSLRVVGALMGDMLGAITDPASNPDLFRRLWEPSAIRHYVVASTPTIGWVYDPRQDISEISAEIAADPFLRSNGMQAISIDAPAVCSSTHEPAPITLTEYRNAILDHYFLSSSAEENAAIDSGGAGPGWEKTGENFAAIAMDYCNIGTAVHRFYGPFAKSHVFTPDPQECGIVRKSGTGWLYEGVAFGAFMPDDGACPSGKRQVWRLYNNRAAQNDSNHRYVARRALIDEMTQRGWVLEGLAFCVNP